MIAAMFRAASRRPLLIVVLGLLLCGCEKRDINQNNNSAQGDAGVVDATPDGSPLADAAQDGGPAVDAAQDGGPLNDAAQDGGPLADAAPADGCTTLTKPSAANTGVPQGVVLTPHNGDLTITTPGTVVEALDVFGRVHVQAADVTVRQSRIRGKQSQPDPTEWIALVSAVSSSCANLLVEDCEIAPTYPSAGANGIQGYRFTSRRNNIHDVVDGLGMMGTDPCRSEHDYIHDLSYFSPDPSHSDNQTHNDCIQFHGGGNHVVIGSFLSAYVSTTSGTLNSPVPQAMSCLMINEAVNLTVTDCWMEGGYYPINGGDSDNVGLDLGTYWRNLFDGARNDPPNFDKTPPFSIVMKTGSISDVGAGTANANLFYDCTEVLVRYY